MTVRYAIGTALAGLGLLFCAPQAAASPSDLTSDELEFVHDMNAIGILAPAADDPDTAAHTIASEGWEVCGMVSQGYSPTDVAYTIYKNSRGSFGSFGGVTALQAKDTVALALNDLCPELA